ncbi:MAG TPA: glycosyl hydrolase family 28-related protein [Candidatus Acidoferrales bacterium]
MVCIIAALLLSVSSASAQGSRKDDIVFGPSGHPVAGATVRICQPTATGAPCSPLATLYTDATLTTTAPNPLKTDGIGNYHFYAPAGRYLIQITGPTIEGTQNYPDVILASDASSDGSGSDISAFGLTLGGDLSVAGNATVNGTLTTTNFSPGTFTPSSLKVSGNTALSGPRPYIDVTAPPYNADPTGASDATAAIQAAISAACAIGLGSRPGVYLPPGTYSVTQTQTGISSTAPIFTMCGDLYVYSNGSQSGSAQFRSAPQGAQINVRAGGSPNSAAVFAFKQQSNSTVENLEMTCWNECISAYGSTGLRFKNDALAVNNTGDADNAPLKLTNGFWFWIEGGTLETPTGSMPTLLLTGDTPLGSEAPLVGLLFVRDVVTAGGGFEYIQRVGQTSSPGTWSFRNVTQEDAAMPFLTIKEASSGLLAQVINVTFDTAGQSDTSGAQPLVLLNATSGALYRPVFINSGTPGSQLVEVQSGRIAGYDSLQGFGAVVDGSGNLVGTGVVSGVGFDGRDHTSPAIIPSEQNAFPQACSGFSTGCVHGTLADRWFDNALGGYSTIGIDGSTGVLFGQGNSLGYTAGINQNSVGGLDVETERMLPPTNLIGNATTGGSLGAGTYYGILWTADSPGACSISERISNLAYAPAVTVGGSNNAINFTWTAPTAAPVGPGAYCLQVTTTNPGTDGPVQQDFQFSAPATSMLYTGQSQTVFGTAYFAGTYLVGAHRFTYNSLGVNTTTPNYNLDVNGTAAVNSLNGVQKAERFTGTDAGLQINACLAAASTTSGVCDARGMTGTYTATHHISIPAHTALMWCQGKLTINDSGTNDAVEFAGDGGAMYGCGEAGSGTVPRPQTSGYIACGIAGCTAVDNPSAATANIDWIHIDKMYLQADGASSTVLNLSSVGHADIENNRFVLGTGGGSYGVYGNTSAGNEDSTNSLVKHNEFDAQSQNDMCLYLAGVFNSIKVEQNSCYLPAENTGTIGFALAKDSNGNYPDNDEFDANDCEAATTSFGQICFNLIGAQNVQIGPTNRCENVYNCIQYPADGSAVGNHMIDPYLSLSVNTMVKPNEPAAAQQAMDNTGTNWQPSFHYGLNDLGGANLLANPGFEGWSNSTALFDWGGVSGTNINQAGSGIYAQQSSGSAPADSTTQGTYSVKIGDNATAGLGINSGCIAVDSTMNYTLAFRVASMSTSAKFRPGFRFYSDPNCTEADRITSVATNARVLQPAYYAGTSALAGTGANWQSTNASLTYNNGITCNCSVTGADFNAATANAWTPTRNFAITFRVPNAFSSSSTTAQSMRVFLLENTAANPNQIFVDDVALSQGPVNTLVPHASMVTENGACVGCGINTVTSYSVGAVTAGAAPGAANQVDLSVIYLPDVSFSHITVDVSTADSSTSDFYSWAITDLAGNVKCSMSSAVNLTATGANQQACSQGTVTLANGNYIFAFTGNATTAKIAYSGTAPLALSSAVSTSSSSSGVISFPIGMPTAGQTYSSYGLPAIILN